MDRPYYCLTIGHLSDRQKAALLDKEQAERQAEGLRSEARRVEEQARKMLLSLESRYDKKLEVLQQEFEDRIIHMSGKYSQLQSEKKNLEVCFDQKFKQCKDLETTVREQGNRLAELVKGLGLPPEEERALLRDQPAP